MAEDHLTLNRHAGIKIRYSKHRFSSPTMSGLASGHWPTRCCLRHFH